MERTRITNCLRIHMMDTEELARFLFNEFVDSCCENCPAYSQICSNNPKYYDEAENYDCIEALVKWLEKECD